VPFADPGRFVYLADLYSQLASSDAVRAVIRKKGPIDGTVQAATVLTETGSSSPLIAIYGKAASKALATALTLRATSALISYIDKRQESAGIVPTQRIELKVVREPDSPVLLQPRGKTLPIVVFLAVLVCVFALIFILENRSRDAFAPRVEALPREAASTQSRFAPGDRIERSGSDRVERSASP